MDKDSFRDAANKTLMKVTVLFFANLKTIADKDRFSITIPLQTCIRDLKPLIVMEIPELEDGLSTALAAINRNFAGDDDEIPADAEVAFFPPMRGG